MNEQLFKSAEETIGLLKKHNLKIASAESCTGGMVSSYITSVSGVSDVFEMGITTYSCRIKHEALGVNKDTLDKFGAICDDTARQMAENIRKISGADIGVSVTGVAGPESSEGHPMGYVFIALADGENTIVKLLDIKPVSRNFVRESTVEEVFCLIKKYIKEKHNEEH